MQYLEKNNHRNIHDSWSVAGKDLDRYLPWDHNCAFALTFKKSEISPITFNESWVRPYEIIVDGSISRKADICPLWKTAAEWSPALSQYGVFSFGSYFEHKNKKQSRAYPSSTMIICSPEGTMIDFTYCGTQKTGIELIAEEAKEIILKSGLIDEDKVNLSRWAVRAGLESVNTESVRLLSELVQRLGSGKVFSHSWTASIMGVDEENVNKHAFELYNRVAESKLTADKTEVVFRLQFMDMRGLDVVRQLCEGETNHTIPLGTFRHRKKMAMLGIFTNHDGHRLSLTLKDTPTDEEWAQLESALGTPFARTPFA